MIGDAVSADSIANADSGMDIIASKTARKLEINLIENFFITYKSFLFEFNGVKYKSVWE